jgi:hypothetical protein
MRVLFIAIREQDMSRVNITVKSRPNWTIRKSDCGSVS